LGFSPLFKRNLKYLYYGTQITLQPNVTKFVSKNLYALEGKIFRDPPFNPQKGVKGVVFSPFKEPRGKNFSGEVAHKVCKNLWSKTPLTPHKLWGERSQRGGSQNTSRG